MRTFFPCVILITFMSVNTATISAAEKPSIDVQQLFKGLETPVYVTHDGTERLYICEQPGRIRVVLDGKLQPKPFLSIESRVFNQGECGFLSVAFHPQFQSNGRLFVNYTERQPDNITHRPQIKTIISEFKTDPKATTVDAATERVLLAIDQPYPNHNGGQVQFGPDGMLYIGMGDGGAGGDPQNRAQNPKEWLGKMLRIDVDHEQPYAVPKDNPFVKQSAYRPEIYALGMRNPWRFSFDRLTGELYAADVGQNIWEEVDIIEKGGNYGWRIREGLHEYNKRDPRDGKKLLDPIKEYVHADGNNSITGGYVYRGKSIPNLVGWYVYADFSSGRVWGLKYEKGKLTGDELLLKLRGQISSFGEDRDGEIYLCDHGRGGVYRLVGKN